jgi:3-deoxy-manno-octulosonate cytidylyltransferase (CMP-KDO synthetase)
MKIVGVIPARWGSTRFEGKALAMIQGKPMIQHVWERARESKMLNDLLIACDDDRIMAAAAQFGAKAVLTSKDHASGTDRIIEAVQSVEGDIIINVQGDEPLIRPEVIDQLAQALVNDPSCSMATVLKVLTTQKELKDPNVVKAVVNGEMNALYFSRSPIPYDRDGNDEVVYYKHLGLYAYRRDFLLSYKSLPKSNLEKTEKLEQLRALEFGYKIKTIVTDVDTIGVDTPQDLARVEKLLSKGKASWERSSR